MSRVLVVEDEAHLAQGLRFNLEAEGYSAEVVADGEAATDRLLSKKENFDAIVLDIMLPAKMVSAWSRSCARRGIMCQS
jgi:DNA-binding response OmpR family regulator